MQMIEMMLVTLSLKAKAFVKQEKGAVDIVAIVVMIGIAVALALVFRESISKLVQNLLRTINGNAETAVGTIKTS